MLKHTKATIKRIEYYIYAVALARTKMLIAKVKAKRKSRIVFLFLLKKMPNKDFKIIGIKTKKPNIPKPTICSSVNMFTFSCATLQPKEGEIFIKLKTCCFSSKISSFK